MNKSKLYNPDAALLVNRVIKDSLKEKNTANSILVWYNTALLRLLFLLCSLVAAVVPDAQTSLTFHSLHEVYTYADNHSTNFQTAGQQSLLAKYETLAARLAMFNLKGDASFSSVKNTALPVSFIPTEIFGGPSGTFKQVTLGQTYTSTAALAPQIDILSPYNAAKVKAAKANEKLTQINNTISKKDLYESIAGAYYNILSYQWQIDVTGKTLANADTLTQIFSNKQREGIARTQDVSNAMANQLLTEDKLQQLQVQLAEQYNSLKILCDIEPAAAIAVQVDDKPNPSFDSNLSAAGNLLQQQRFWQQQYQDALLRADKKWFLPTLTFFSSFTLEQFSNSRLYDNSKWFPINFAGLKLTAPLLPDANKIAAVKYDRIDLRMAQINEQHAALQDSINNQQLKLDYQKAFKSYQLAAQIASLKEDAYRKNFNIYKEGILSATDLFTSFNDWLNSSLNMQAQLANSEYYAAKILISDTVK